MWPLSHPLAGHCYVATEAFYLLTGGDEKWQIERVFVEVEVEEPGPLEGVSEFTHWFLRDKQTGSVVDLTSEQFTEYQHCEVKIPYENGTVTHLKKPSPSKRTQKLLDKIDL